MTQNLPSLMFFRALLAWSISETFVSVRRASRVSLAIVGAYVLVAFAGGTSLGDIASGLSCGLAVLLVGFALFCVGWMASADAKLLAAMAVWLGWHNLLALSVGTVLVGLLLHPAFSWWRSRPLPKRFSASALIREIHDRSAIPFGIGAALTAAVLSAGSPAMLGSLLGT